jgi:hypothetical protein
MLQRTAWPTVAAAETGVVRGTTRSVGAGDGTNVAPARVTTAVVIASSARLRVSARMSDQMKNVPIARTTVAIITGTNSRRSSLRDIFLTRHRSSHLFAGIDFEIVNGEGLNGRS